MKFLDFEKDIESVENKILDLEDSELNYTTKKNQLEIKREKLLKKIYSNLSPWQKVQVARHSNRPHTLDYIKYIFNDVILLHGDKKYSDDKAVIGGFAKILDKSVMVIGTEKGNSMESRIMHNFGMARPEGYRKAQRLMRLAEKFKLPIITFVDTAGAFPGKEAEERGQSESIASSILVSLRINTPIISVIIGEGGSGGAIGLATADKTLMLEHAMYSVISPEGCASILWRESEFTQKAAETLKLTAQDCYKFKIVDEIINETYGGAHRFPENQASLVKKSLIANLNSLEKVNSLDLVTLRNDKYLNITSSV